MRRTNELFQEKKQETKGLNVKCEVIQCTLYIDFSKLKMNPIGRTKLEKKSMRCIVSKKYKILKLDNIK